MIFSPTTPTRSNAVKRHQKFKFPIDEFFSPKLFVHVKKNIKQNSKLYFCFFAFCHYCYYKMELSIRVQKKQKTVFVISFFSFFAFFLRCSNCFWKICLWQVKFLLKKKWQVGRKNIFSHYFTIITATIITAIEKAKKFSRLFQQTRITKTLINCYVFKKARLWFLLCYRHSKKLRTSINE